MKRCPHCASHGLYRNRRALWRRLLGLPHTYSCIDCGADFSRRRLLAAQAKQLAAAQGCVHEMSGGRQGLAPGGIRRLMAPAPALLRRLTLPRRRLAAPGRDGGLAGRGRHALDTLLQGAGLTPISVWALKQVDGDLLHLCGSGTLEHQQSPWGALSALRQGRYRGGVRMGDSGIVLNSRLFAALIPLDEMTLKGPARGHWQGREWRVALVPRRSWEHEGRLVAHRDVSGEDERLISSEDVTGIRDHIDPQAAAPGSASFRAGIGRPEGFVVRGPIRRRDS
ncbi:hypothetical protein [Halomonas sp. JS92-SW72]|uniref:hypothetical protein n=1 Tax=Halomonas sp. JS92-SW72 TaxID=2306583 RepID=UPI0013C2DD54|nr:hypothetical protein [Halomonas sp. JS92-SW72]